MDYDENNFQNHNFQLAGEDHTFPENLDVALSLPKFGLDEHLRFDSLAETEGLLGIQGQGSNWIEDYSPGGSAIEFSSSGAESSSIISHKNVWLEATSSESVEMLLKSVGEYEMIGQKAVFMDSRADDGLHGVDDLLDLHVKKDETHNLTLRGCQSNDLELSQDNHLKIASDLTEDSRDFQPQFQALLQEAKVEESRIVLDATPSSSEFSSGRVIGEQNSGDENFVYRESSDVEIEKNLITPRVDETTNQHAESTSGKSKVADVKNSIFFEQKIVSLSMVNKKCSTIFSVNSDGLLEVVACPDKSLNCDGMICDEVCGKQAYSGSLVKKDDSNFKNSSGKISAEVKVPELTEGFKTTGCRQYGFIDNDDVHMKECLSNKSSSMFSIGGGILGTCMDVEEKQEPDDKEAVNTNTDVGVTPHLLRESYTSHINYDTQATDTKEYHSQKNNGEKKSETVVLDSLAEDMAVDMPEVVNLDTDEDVAQVISKEAQDLPSGDWKATEMSSFVDPSAKKLLQEELDSDPVSMRFQKSADLQLTNSDDISDMDVIGQQKELLTQGSPVSHTTHSDATNVEMSAVSSSMLKIALGSEKASDPALVFHPVKAKGTLHEEMSQDYLGSKDKSLLLEAQIGCQSSSVQRCGSPTLMSYRGCPQDEPEHQELNGSLSDCNATTSCGINLISPEKEGIAGKGRSSRHDFKENDMSLEDGGFTFKVLSSENSPESYTGCNSKSFSNLQPTENPQLSKEIHSGCPEEGEVLLVSTKTPGQAKTRDASMPFTKKGTASEVMAAKSSSGTPNSDVTLSKDIQLVDMREHSYLKCSTAKTSALTIHTSILPDLNSSVSSSALFSQPFTDLQQVQLRAQIFVYGALISSIHPDEAYMVSAFGGTDGGRSLWESVWHSIVDRFPNQKSTIAGYDTPSSSRPVPSRDACRPLNPTIQAAAPCVFLSSTSSSTITMKPVFPIETTKKTPNHRTSKNTHTPQKARKSKNGAATEQHSFPVSQPSREDISVTSVVKSLPLLPASLPSSSNLSTKTATGAHFSVSTGETYNNTECRVILSKEIYNNIEQAKLEAEDAASLAVSAVEHSQATWSRLDAQRNSGLVPEVEEKFTSAAVAVAAAASVAKAAAAAAKVASEAAFQVKIMFDEAITSAKSGNANQSSENRLPDVGKQLAGLTPISILKGKDIIHGSGAVISAAREAARMRVEAASAATKWAENLDAIVKAAELAAEAVAQAGIIIAMGDPLPSTCGLVDSGLDDFWKAQYATSLKLAKPSSLRGDEHRGLDNVEDHGLSAKQFDERFSSIRETERTSDKGGLTSLNENHHNLEGMPQGNLSNSGKGRFNPVNNTSIQKGSLVEIMSDKDGRRGAWFSARVLDVKDNNAYVCYNDVLSHGGQLKEWLALDNEDDKPPKIRRAHNTTTVKYEGTRKRRREHLTSYIWAVGDHVDAWIHDGWWEGIVTEKGLGDETKLTVHFPARGDKQIIHAWDLRQSLVWKEGQWLYWSLSSKESLTPHEGVTPQKKRQRLCRINPCGTSNQPKNITSEESRKPEESRSLILSAKNRTFSNGKHGSSTNVLGIPRTGLQKEGSRVVFGIPKSGKKKKFIEVSKHYIANNPEKINEGSHSITFAKYLMPRVGHQTKNTSKVDSKGQKAGESKPNGGVKAERLQNIQTRSQAEKNSSSLTVSNGEIGHGCHSNFTSSFSSNGNSFEKKNSSESGSFPLCSGLTNVTAIEPDTSMQLAAASYSSKKKSAPGSKIEFTLKRKPTVGRPTKVEERGSENPGKAVPEAMEHRRSNRRIQPTSRLLEGLQSSATISKVACLSHERKFHKGGSSSRGNDHG